MTTDTVRLSRIARVVNGGTPASDSEYWEGDVPWATPVDLGANHGSSLRTTLRALTPAGVATGSTIVPARSVLVSTRAPIGYVAVNEVPMAFNQGVKALVPGRQTDAVFLGYAIQANAANLQAAGQGSTFSELSTGALASTRVPAVEVGQQRRIAEFLDRETAQIDELIAKQEQLISTLAERSAAFRFHLTTGGLEERSRSVPSNSPWFPDLPERWVMAPVKYHARTGAGAGFPLEAQGLTDEQYPFLKVNALSRADDDGVIRWKEDTVSIEMASKLGAKIYPAGSCIIAKIGAALLMGRVRQLSAPSCVDNNVMALIPQGSTNPRFLYYALQNLRPDWLVNPGAVPSTSEGAVGRVRLPFPPAAEQIAIAKALDVYMGKVMATERKLEAALTVLRERRQALISAAVTGQIDVGGAS